MLSSIKRIVNNALRDYSNRPEILYSDETVILRGGHWAARDDVEAALDKRHHVDAVQNHPTGKTIYIK